MKFNRLFTLERKQNVNIFATLPGDILAYLMKELASNVSVFSYINWSLSFFKWDIEYSILLTKY